MPTERPLADPSCLSSRDVFRLLGRSWPFIRPYRRHLLRLLVALVPAVAAALLALLLVRIFFDAVGNGRPLTAGEAWMLGLAPGASRQAVLWRASMVSALSLVVGLPVVLFTLGYAVWILQCASNLFRVNLYNRLQELEVSFHFQEKIGDAIFRMFQDSAAMPQLINGLLIQPIRWLPFAIADLVWLALFNYAMAAVALALLPANLVLALLFAGPMRRAFLRAREASALATTRIEETLASIKAVKAFGREEHESLAYARDNWEAFVAARRARMLSAAYRVCTNMVRGVAYVAVLYFGARQVMTGGRGGLFGAAISLGLFEGAMIAFGRMSASVRHLTVSWGDLQDVCVGLARVFQMLDRKPEHEVPNGGALPAPPRRALSFEHVCFGYEPLAPVLAGVDLEACVGKLTAVVGPSGAGKSTMVSLLLRFFDPARGRVALDGRDIREFDLAAWRNLLSVVLQESPLFTATLRENIAYGRPGASTAELLRAAEFAGLGSFVRSLPAGLETMLGEKGAKLSAGQAQRIGLARALLRGAPILVLDEPTSALDVATEEQVMRGLEAWLGERPERLIIIATHRRTAASRAGRIYRIESGRVARVEPRALDMAPPPELNDG